MPPETEPLDTLPLAEVVRLVLARQGSAADAAGITAAADLVCRHLAAGGRLLLQATDPTTAARVASLPTLFTHEYGFADGAVRPVGPSGPTPTPRDAVVVLGSGTVAPDRRPNVVVLTFDDGDDDGTAVLEALTTAVAAHLGHLHDEFPVDLVADSDADRERVVAMVAAIAAVEAETARRAAAACGFDTRAAVVHLVGGLTPGEAALLAANRRTLRDALAALPRVQPRS